ncbi:MAG: hypothetical protein ACKOA9_11060, partial [Actinomycetota bacterium]
VLLYVAVNYAKFGTLLSAPLEKQDVLARISPRRRAALAATGNSLFGFEYIPTNLVQYLRPDGIGFRITFPWITFSRPPHIFGGAVYDNIEVSASITATSTFLVLLCIPGVVSMVRSRADAVPSVAVFRIPLLSAALATSSTVAIAVIFQRYEGDFVPVLVLGAAPGLAWLGAWLVHRRWWTQGAVAVVLTLCALWTLWATTSVTLIYQREVSAFQSAEARAKFLDFQLDVNGRLGLAAPTVRRGPRLPESREWTLSGNPPQGELFVVGDCRRLYISTGQGWELVERRIAGFVGSPLCDRLTVRG